jgi:hypothetical protein
MQPPDVTPLTTLAGWRQFVRRPPVQAPTEPPDGEWAAGNPELHAEHTRRRIEYHTELAALQTPELRRIVTTGRGLLLLNQRQYGARRGLLVSGEPTTGKSTAITQLGRAVELAYRRLRPGSDDAAPVVYLTMPPQATPKSLSIEILKFLGAPYLARDPQIELTRQACHLLADLRNQLLIVDEIHNLDHHTRAGADASDHLKFLAENVASTFVYAGIDTARTGLFNGIRGRQLAGRFVPIHTRPYPYATTGDRTQWRDLVTGFDSMLRLHHHQPGTLTRLAPYLHARTAGSISSLSMLIRFAAVTAIGDGTERITKTSLHDVPLDHAAATFTPARPRRATAAAAGAKPPAA